MRILGIESSSLVASTAIYEDGITMAEYTVEKECYCTDILTQVSAIQ